MVVIPEKNGCVLECSICEYSETCEFKRYLSRKVKKWTNATNRRTRKVNEEYGYNTKPITSQTGWYILKKSILDGCKCKYCGKSMIFPYIDESTNLLHVSLEHIIPLSKGGSNNPDNLTTCHDGCNKEMNNNGCVVWVRKIDDKKK